MQLLEIETVEELRLCDYNTQYHPHLVIMPVSFVDLLDYSYVIIMAFAGNKILGIINKLEDVAEV